MAVIRWATKRGSRRVTLEFQMRANAVSQAVGMSTADARIVLARLTDAIEAAETVVEDTYVGEVVI